MSWYRKSKNLLDGFRNFTSKIVPRNPLQPSTPTLIHRNSSAFSSSTTNPGLSGFLRSSLILRRSGFELGAKRNQSFLGTGRRYYHVDRHQVQHFKPRGPRRWFKNPRVVISFVLLGSGIVITVYFGNLESVPYTHRKHFVLLSRNLERQLGEKQFEQLKKELRGYILPAIHPESVRVRVIAKYIIEALQRGLRQEQAWTDPGYAEEGGGVTDRGGQNEISMLSQRRGGDKVERGWTSDDEILDDKWVQKSRKHGQERGSRPSTDHLEGLNWEVLVVNKPIVNAFCLPGGKIVVFTGLLKHFRTDEEIATILGHEIGHAVARHAAEMITKNLWFAIIQLVLYQFILPDLVNTMSHLLLRLPFSRRMEMEADYIGLLLMASAGYDPRIAPSVYEKLGKLMGDSALRDYLSTHPSGKKRASLLANAKVMEEALAIFKSMRAGRGVEGFLSDSINVIL